MAHWLARCGLAMDGGGVIPSDVSNPQGYFEDLDFVRLHAAHIRRLAPASGGWKLVPDTFLAFGADERTRALQIVQVRFGVSFDWGWKDPRATLFLPQWKEIIPDLKVVLVWRPCAEVVTSLLVRAFKQRRRHLFIDPVSAVRLWAAYNRLVCDFRDGHPGDALLIAAGQLPDSGPVVFDHLTARWGFSLCDCRMDDVYDSGQLHAAPGWAQRLSAALGAPAIEARLRASSVEW